MKVNINDLVWVRLTKDGLKTFEDAFRGDKHKPTSDLVMRKGGWYEFQLRELMLIFGPKSYFPCQEIQFVDNEILLKKPQ